MKILVVNCGSSSLKYQLIDSATEEVSASGQCERIGLDGIFSIKVNGKKIEKEVDIPDHSVGMKTVLDALVDPEHAVLKSLDEIEAIGHRVVHAISSLFGRLSYNYTMKHLFFERNIAHIFHWLFFIFKYSYECLFQF